MKNDAATAQLGADKKSCELSDIEYRENVTSMWSINEQGEPQDEVGMTDGDFQCYYCNNCGIEFDGLSDDFGRISVSANDAWEAAKEHISQWPKE